MKYAIVFNLFVSIGIIISCGYMISMAGVGGKIVSINGILCGMMAASNVVLIMNIRKEK